MERPQPAILTKQRTTTGEILYLDEMRRQDLAPRPFIELGDMAIQMYEAAADLYPANERPAIMQEYEDNDPKPSQVVVSCLALANILLEVKEPADRFTFVDIAIEDSPVTVLDKLRALSVGAILAGEDEQLAIESDGEYYPVLDMRKQNAKLVGVGLRAWGWDDAKYGFTKKVGEPYKYPKHALVYPSDEKSCTRQLELSFAYRNDQSTIFTESISLYLSDSGSATISSQVWAMAYAETGYEGHGGSSFQTPTDEDIAAFGDLIAEIVGNEPESILMKQNRQLQALTDATATPSAKQAVQKLIEATWPAQAQYFLTREQTGEDSSIADQLCNEATADQAITAIHEIIKAWKAK